MNRVALIHRLGRSPETRSVEEIERDLEDEFAFHLASTAATLIEKGVSPDEARAQARARFGDVERHKRRCRCIALEDQMMFKRIHLAVTIVLAVAVVALVLLLVSAVRVQSQTLEDAMRQRELALMERERSEAVTSFLSSVLSSSDLQAAAEADVDAMLERAEIAAREMDDPYLAERIRATIEHVRKRAENEDAPADPPADPSSSSPSSPGG